MRASVVFVRVQVTGVVHAPGFHGRSCRARPVRRQFLQPVGDALDFVVKPVAALTLVAGVRGESVEIFKKIGPHQLDHFKRGVSEQRTAKGVFPSALFPARVGVFHASIVGRSFGTAQAHVLAGPHLVPKVTLCEISTSSAQPHFSAGAYLRGGPAWRIVTMIEDRHPRYLGAGLRRKKEVMW